MGKYALACLVIFALQLSSLLNTLACPYCTDPTPISNPPPPPPKSPPPCVPQAPHAPVVTPSPPPPPKAPVAPSPPPPSVPKPPKAPVHPPPPSVPKPPKAPVHPPPPSVPKPPKAPVHPPPPPPSVPKSPPKPPMSPPPPQHYCPIDTLKLHTCVDLLGGLVHLGIGENAQAECCPLLHGLADLDAALCLCTTIKAKLLNIDLKLPVLLELLVNCGHNPPSGFRCPH